MILPDSSAKVKQRKKRRYAAALFSAQRAHSVRMRPESIAARLGHSEFFLQSDGRRVILVHVANGHAPFEHDERYHRAFERLAETAPTEPVEHGEHAHAPVGVPTDEPGEFAVVERAEHGMREHNLAHILDGIRSAAARVMPEQRFGKRRRELAYIHAAARACRRQSAEPSETLACVRLKPEKLRRVLRHVRQAQLAGYGEPRGVVDKIGRLGESAFVQSAEPRDGGAPVMEQKLRALVLRHVEYYPALYRELFPVKQHNDMILRARAVVKSRK